MEIWKDIENFEGYYQVSNTGKIKSLKRFIKNGNGIGVRSVRERILKASYGKRHGYYSVSLQKNGDCKSYKVHRLVAQAFIPNPLKLNEVNHINCIKKDNNANNLEWVTLQENRTHASLNGLTPRGESHGGTKLTQRQALEIKYGHEGLTHQEIAEIYGLHKHTVSNIRRGLRWQFIDECQELLESESKWISVDDRLPERASFVIAHKANGLVLGLHFNSANKFMYGDIDQTSQVLHWMKLPGPPVEIERELELMGVKQ